MSSQTNAPEDLVDCIARLSAIVDQLIKGIDALIGVTIGHESATQLRKEETPIPKLMVDTLILMLQAAGSSSHTLTLLSKAPGLQTRDCYSIVRSIVEIAVNICYIIAEGPDAAQRALHHAQQKTYQDLERESRIGDQIIRLAFSGRPEPSAVPDLDAAIAEFTSRTGREKGWTELNIDQRIEIPGQKLGGSISQRLHFARFMIYRHSSEVLHGTLFSALYFFGLTLPSPAGHPRSQSKIIEYIGQQHMLILFATVLALASVIEAFHRAYGFAEAYERSETLVKSLNEIPYFKKQNH